MKYSDQPVGEVAVRGTATAYLLDDALDYSIAAFYKRWVPSFITRNG